MDKEFGLKIAVVEDNFDSSIIAAELVKQDAPVMLIQNVGGKLIHEFKKAEPLVITNRHVPDDYEPITTGKKLFKGQSNRKYHNINKERAKNKRARKQRKRK